MSGNGRQHYIGLCLSGIQEYMVNDFVHAAVKRTVERGAKLLIYTSFSDMLNSSSFDLGEKKVFDHIDYKRLDGLIIMGETIKDEAVLDSMVKKAKEHGVFTVCVDKSLDGCFNIEYDYRKAFEEIVRHVIEKHGCRTVNLVAGVKGNEFSEERVESCRAVMAAHGIELDSRRILYGDFWSGPTEREFDAFMKSGLEMPDVFICCNDTMAITVCTKLKEYGFSVPGDVLVTGFDGIIEEQYHIPRLTTGKQDTELAGEKAVDAVLDHVNGIDVGNSCIIEHKVILAHSCGCKKIDYREATGQITPLFAMFTEDKCFDTFMSDFSISASAANTISELSEKILANRVYYGYYYYALSLNEDFMNISDDYEKFITDSEENQSSTRLILCETLFDRNFPPCFADGPQHFDEAAESISVFLFWALHFQGKNVGCGTIGMSTGIDGFTANDDIRHMTKYSRSLNHVLEIANSQSVLKKVIAKLQDLYIRDHTGLYNRNGFFGEIAKHISNAKRNPKRTTYLVVISVDMDGLKFINDTYGHGEGDIAIKTVANALISVWGASEICSRFGGDEFTVASVCANDPENVGKNLIENIKKQLDNFNATSGKPYRVESSFGMQYAKIDKDFDVDALIKQADALMYSEKVKHHRSRSASREH